MSNKKPNEPIPNDACEAIADKLRTVANDIEHTESFGTWRVKNDVEPLFVGHAPAGHRLHSSKMKADIESKRFHCTLTIHDNKPTGGDNDT